VTGMVAVAASAGMTEHCCSSAAEVPGGRGVGGSNGRKRPNPNAANERNRVVPRLNTAFVSFRNAVVDICGSWNACCSPLDDKGPFETVCEALVDGCPVGSAPCSVPDCAATMGASADAELASASVEPLSTGFLGWFSPSTAVMTCRAALLRALASAAALGADSILHPQSVKSYSRRRFLNAHSNVTPS
jgi:hypothetical protein